MDANEFSKRAKETVDYCVDYVESLSERRVFPDMSPGFLISALPPTAPEKGESFEKIMQDIETHILPGTTHWQHPSFHAYFPANSSYPSILGELISDTVGGSTYNWSISVSEKELESIVTNWFGKMIGLPDDFLHSGTDSVGGGFINNSCSDCMFYCMIAARQEALKRLQDKNPSVNTGTLLQSLVAYTSKEAHSCIEKASMMALVNLRMLDTDEQYRLRGETLAEAIEEDVKQGLIPFFASITLGTTNSSACDPIDEIGLICSKNGIWLNVDGAYGGSAMICPENRHLLKGIEYASTFVVNPVKGMLTNFEGGVLWTKYRSKLEDVGKIENELFHDHTEKIWYQANSRFRALKLWFVIRNYGVEGLQKNIRNQAHLAKIFENYVKSDQRFELFTSQFGLVCFRLKGSNMLNRRLVAVVNESGKLHIGPCLLNYKYVIRFCICSTSTTEEDVTYAWSVFCEFAEELLEGEKRIS